MTSSEDEILEVMQESLPQLGAQCDALTGDGLLARPMHESAGPPRNGPAGTRSRSTEQDRCSCLISRENPPWRTGQRLADIPERAKTRQWAHLPRSKTSVVNPDREFERTQTNQIFPFHPTHSTSSHRFHPLHLPHCFIHLNPPSPVWSPLGSFPFSSPFLRKLVNGPSLPRPLARTYPVSFVFPFSLF